MIRVYLAVRDLKWTFHRNRMVPHLQPNNQSTVLRPSTLMSTRTNSHCLVRGALRTNAVRSVWPNIICEYTIKVSSMLLPLRYPRIILSGFIKFLHLIHLKLDEICNFWQRPHDYRCLTEAIHTDTDSSDIFLGSRKYRYRCCWTPCGSYVYV